MLFNKRLLQTHLNAFEYPQGFDFERAEKIVGNWQKAIKDGNYDKTKETQVQSSFLNLFFNIILGYSEMHDNSDEWFLLNEAKTELDGTKADGALGYFTKDDKTNVTRAVIELKDAKTSLDAKQSSRKDYDSPVSQAFSYSSKFDRCDWIIVSNFKEIRVYNKERGQGYFESFEILNLGNEKEFKRFYFLLCKQNLLDKNRNSLLDNLVKDTTKNEEEISKQFYKDFKALRQELFQHICEHNPDIDKKSLLEKTQKLLDRLIFIFFCEDTNGLLPTNITRTVYDLGIKSRERSDTRIWREFKNLFMDIDEGRHDIDPPINAYNGGLFAADKILENLIIKDSIWINIIKLSDYDFESDLNVNILGHIFEQSLSDLEQIKAEIDTQSPSPLAGEGRGEGSAFDKTKSKRKKDGIFYTPEYITKYIVEQTVGKYLEENPDKLETIKILDPACGSGAFLNQAHAFLKTQYEIRHEEKLNQARENETLNMFEHINLAETDRSILLNNIYGVDLNEESTEITKLALWLKTARKDQPLQNLDNNIKCGNSLIDDPEIAGDKAFLWEKEFGNKLLTQGHDPVFKEKELKAFHITFKTYNSFSEEAEGILLSNEDEIIVLKEICNVIKDDKIRVLAINICSNHVHMILVCEQDEIETYIQKIKSVSSRKYNIIKGKTIADKETTIQLPKSEKTQNRLWAKGYNVSFVETEDELANKVNYVQYNRQKHNLKDVSELRVMTLSPQVLTSFERAFSPQYSGGFDCIVGNPPYGAELDEKSKEYIYKNYSSIEYQIDTYIVFIEKALKLLNQGGKLAFIVPSTWLNMHFFKKIRNQLINETKLEKILLYKYQVFEEVTAETCVFVCSKADNTNNFVDIVYLNNAEENNHIEFKQIAQDYWKTNYENGFNIFYNQEKINLIEKIFVEKYKLKDIVTIKNGIKPYEVGKGNPKQSKDDVKNRIFDSNSKLNNEYLQYIVGGNIKKYYVITPTTWIKYGENLAAPRKDLLFDNTKIVIRQTSDKIISAVDNNGFLNLNNVHNVLKKDNVELDLNYLTTILNSKLMDFAYKYLVPEAGRVFAEVKAVNLGKLPIAKTTQEQQTSLANKAEQMIELNKQLHEGVKSALGLLNAEYGLRNVRTEGHDPQFSISKKLEKFHTLGANIFLEELEKQGVKLSLSQKEELLTWYNKKAEELNNLKTQIEQLDHSIDQEVYKLYNLTDEEIKIIEGK